MGWNSFNTRNREGIHINSFHQEFIFFISTPQHNESVSPKADNVLINTWMGTGGMAQLLLVYCLHCAQLPSPGNAPPNFTLKTEVTVAFGHFFVSRFDWADLENWLSYKVLKIIFELKLNKSLFLRTQKKTPVMHWVRQDFMQKALSAAGKIMRTFKG